MSRQLSKETREKNNIRSKQRYEELKEKTGYIVYRLKKDEDIIYVGKTINLHVRILNHKKDKDFDTVEIISVNTELEQSLLEMYFIKKYNPVLNKEFMRDDIYSSPFINQDLINKMEWVVVGDTKNYERDKNVVKDLDGKILMYLKEGRLLIDSADTVLTLCKRHNLDDGAVYRVLNGIRSSHKGFIFEYNKYGRPRVALTEEKISALDKYFNLEIGAKECKKLLGLSEKNKSTFPRLCAEYKAMFNIPDNFKNTIDIKISKKKKIA